MTAATGLPKDLITVPEAARRLGIGIDTAKRLVRDGDFPGGAALKVGRQWRVSVPRLERWLHGDAQFSEQSTTGTSAAHGEHTESPVGGAGRVGPGLKGDHGTAARSDLPSRNADAGSPNSRLSA